MIDIHRFAAEAVFYQMYLFIRYGRFIPSDVMSHKALYVCPITMASLLGSVNYSGIWKNIYEKDVKRTGRIEVDREIVIVFETKSVFL
ncbi:hypothetical protein C1H46_004011 [Malus baccata]|uniref:Uncharacterized protein n=1 Tax=Malus baccata TaxID=106549 RepID=A0A540NHC4_MALBA|nr:hypothetical protein C1H46_004011 [Malus baccata]